MEYAEKQQHKNNSLYCIQRFLSGQYPLGRTAGAQPHQSQCHYCCRKD